MRPFYVYDRWGKQVDTIAHPLAATHLDTINGEDSLQLDLIGDPLTKGQRVVWRDKFGTWHEHTVADTTTSHSDGRLTESVYCENSISELLLTFIEERSPKDATSQYALEQALQDTRWTTGNVQSTGVISFNWYHKNAYEAVTDIVEAFGAELSVTIEPREDVIYTRKVNIVNHRGSDLGHLFTYGNNLIGIERIVDTASIYTALYGYGKGVQLYDEETGEATGGYSRKISFKDINDGQAWVGDEEARLRYGVPDGKGGVSHAFGIIEFSDVEDEQELLDKTKEALKQAAEPKVTYSGTVANLAAGGYTNGEDAQPGDTVYLRDRELDERLQGRVLEVNRDLFDESKTTIVLGNLKSKFIQGLQDDKANLDWLKSQVDRWDEAAMLPDAYLDAIVNRLNMLFNNTGGFVYYEKGEGLITYDKPIDQNPTMAIQITGAGFRIANSKNSDGSWNWRTFGTGDGFTADELITGIIKGGSCYWNLATGDLLFNQGIIRSADEKNYWNLSTGELSITSGTMVDDLSLADYMSGIVGDATDDLKREVDKAREAAIKDLEDRRLTQQSIFNTLTNGGSTQGIYLKDGRVYINASYIGSGVMQTGKIQDRYGNNYWDLETGELRITPNVKIGSGSQTLSDYIAANATDSWKTASQKDVFNKLTNNSANQGIYLTGTNLYVNASYIKTGEFDADLITTGKIQDKSGNNYWNLDTGEFRLSATTKVGTSSSSQTLEKYVEGFTDTHANDYVKKDSFSTYLTQKNVFNALTNNGVEKGIYLSGSTLYISGDYIRTGTIESQNGASTWNLNSGYFETSNKQVAGGQTHNIISRIYNGRIALRMDTTDIGQIYVATQTNDANVHDLIIRAFTNLVLSAPTNICTSFSATTSGSVSYTRTLYNQSVTMLTALRRSGTSLIFQHRSMNFAHGMATLLTDALDGSAIPINSSSGYVVASALPASEIGSGENIEIVNILTEDDLNQAAAENRMIWRQDTETGELGAILYTGEGWTCDSQELLGEPSEDIPAAAPEYVDARTEVLQSEIEAITESITTALPAKNAKVLTAKVQSVRAGLVSGDEMKMAKIANELSNTKPIFSVAQAKEVLGA